MLPCPFKLQCLRAVPKTTDDAHEGPWPTGPRGPFRTTSLENAIVLPKPSVGICGVPYIGFVRMWWIKGFEEVTMVEFVIVLVAVGGVRISVRTASAGVIMVMVVHCSKLKAWILNLNEKIHIISFVVNYVLTTNSLYVVLKMWPNDQGREKRRRKSVL